MKSLGKLLLAAPAGVSCGRGRLDVVAVVKDASGKRAIAHWRLDGSDWIQGELTAGPPIPEEGLCAVSSSPGVVDVFAATPAGDTPWWWQHNGTLWLLRGPLPLGARLHPVTVATVCAGADHIDVFAAGLGNTPNWWHWNGTSWSAPVQLPPLANLLPVPLAAVSPRPGRLDVFAAGTRNELWHWWRDEVSPVWHVVNCGGNLPAEGVSAVCWGPDRIDVFAASRGQGNDNPLQHWWWDGDTFNGPESLGGNLVGGTVSAVSVAPNRLDVFGITGDRRLARWQWDGGMWIGPHCVGSGIPAGDVSAVSSAPGRIDVFVRGPDHALWKWPGGGLENATHEPWQNMPGNHGPIPVAGRCRPSSLEELVTVVKEAEQQGRQVRAVGSSWSNSDVAVVPRNESYVVETDQLNRVLGDVLGAGVLTNAGAGLDLLHFEAGIKIHELNTLLDGRNQALSTLGGATGQSFAGALSTGVHGSDFDRGTLPDMVRAIHLVGPGGVQHWIEPSAAITDRARLSAALGIADANIHYDDDWFDAVLVSMGSMGIIYSVILEVVPQYDLVATCEHLVWDTMKARLQSHGGADDPFAGHRALQVVISQFKHDDGTRPCFLTRRKVAAKTAALSSGSPAQLYSVLAKLAIPVLNGNADTYPEMVKSVLFQMLPQGTIRGWSHTAMSTDGDPAAKGLALEIAFDATSDAYLDFVEAALKIFDDEYRLRRLGWGGWMSLRFQGKSRACLSPQSRCARTCTVEFAAAVALRSTRPLLALLEAAGRSHGGIQHWGMFENLTAADVATAYPRLDTWRRVRGQLTNQGAIHTFDNAFTERCGLSAAHHASGGGWELLGLNAIVDGPGVASWSAGRLDVFVRGTDNTLYTKSWGGADWSDYAQLGANGITSDPAAVSWEPNRIDVFVRGTDNAIYTRSWDGARWTEYFGLGGDFTSGPAACSWAAGRLDVFARGTDNALWHLAFDGQWRGWEQLGSEQIASDPAAVSWGTNRIDVFVRGTDDRLYTKSWDGSQWSTYFDLGGVLSSGPAVCSRSPGRLDVFARGSNGVLQHLSHDGGWGGWAQLGTEVITSDPAAVAWGPNRMDVFARGTDNALYHKWWNGSWGP